MTEALRYHIGMNILSVTVQAQGIVWTVLLFLLIAVAVHGIRLSVIGYRTMGKNNEEQPKPPEKPPEPVYYIVEKKKKRSKTEYSEPREVSFK